MAIYNGGAAGRPMVSRHRYPLSALSADYIRGVVGVLLTAGPLLAVVVLPIIGWLLAAAAVLFSFFLARTALRHVTVIEIDDHGIAARGPVGWTIPWSALTDLRLRYYSTRRDREQGWMQLTLRGRGRRLAVESSIEDFDSIASRAAIKARECGIELSEATLNNLVSLGAVPAESGLAERWGLVEGGDTDSGPIDGPTRGSSPDRRASSSARDLQKGSQ